MAWLLSHYWVSKMPEAGNNTESPVWHNFQGWSASYLLAGFATLDHFCHLNGSFVLNEIDIYYRYIFAFPACSVSAQIAIHRLIEYLIRYHGILHSIASDYATNFITNEAWQWAHVLRVFFTIMKQLTCYNCGTVFWRLSYSINWMAIPCRAEARFFKRLWISA